MGRTRDRSSRTKYRDPVTPEEIAETDALNTAAARRLAAMLPPMTPAEIADVAALVARSDAEFGALSCRHQPRAS